MFNAMCTLEVSHQTTNGCSRHTAPAFLATATAKSYAFCHGSSILLLYGGLLRRVCKRKVACKIVTAKRHYSIHKAELNNATNVQVILSTLMGIHKECITILKDDVSSLSKTSKHLKCT